MYARLPQLAALAAAEAACPAPRPVVLCEYAHSMGNSTGNLREYWAAFQGQPGLQGGFIWDWADQALAKARRGADGSQVRGRAWRAAGRCGWCSGSSGTSSRPGMAG